MKRLCICLCSVLLLLTACGRPQTALPSETVLVMTESDPTQAQTQTETALTEDGTTELETTEPQTELQTVPVTTVPQQETKTRNAPTTAAATTQKPQPTRETHTLFTSPPIRTTVKPSTTTTTRPTTTTTTTSTTTTTTTTTSGGYSPAVRPVRRTCTVTIDCRELLDHPEKLKPEKSAFVPKNGYIVKDVTMEFQDGESVYDVLRRVCETHTCTDNCRFCQAEGIQMESTYTPQFSNYYIEGIHQLYEKDCGGTSGWTYYVNDWFPNYGCSQYKVKPGDRIEWVYSIEMDNPQENALAQ